MKFLLPSAGEVDPRFGILTSYKHGVARGVSDGLPWAADLGCIEGPEFVKRYNPKNSLPWLESMSPYKETCLFVTAPDYVGDSKRTLEAFLRWEFEDWPAALVAQDGLEDLELPPADRWAALFIGGSDPWRASRAVVDLIYHALDLGKRIHIGRVNRYRRYKYFRSLEESEGFTCDGTFIRYARDEAIKEWLSYMARPKQYNFFVSRSDRRSESPRDLPRPEDNSL